MEAKLKSLKVADLKAILAKANTPLPSRAVKADLISKILASPDAVEAYNALYPSVDVSNVADDLLAPPEDLDWTADEVTSPKVEETTTKLPVQELSTVVPAEPASDSAITSSSAIAPTAEDTELEKRKQRAARFGIPLVESKSTAKKLNSTAVTQSTDSGNKLSARAERFGLKGAANGKTEGSTSPGSKRKRVAAPPPAEIDPEEAERRLKRAERFGLKA